MGRWLSTENKKIRDEKIYRLNKIDNLSCNQIAKRLGLRKQTVWQIIKKMELENENND